MSDFILGSERKRTTLCLLVVVALTLVVHSSVLRDDFVNIHDGQEVLQNRFIRDIDSAKLKHIITKPIVESYRPLKTLSYALDYKIWGLRPFGYHLTNLLLHILSSALVFLIAWKIWRNRGLALFIALFFSLHPTRVESVAWITGRKDVLSGFFLFLSFYAYLVYKSASSQASEKGAALSFNFVPHLLYLSSVLAFALSLLSKPTGICQPFVLLFYGFILERKRGKRFSGIALKSLPFFLVAAAYLLYTAFGTRTTAVPGEGSGLILFRPDLMINRLLIFSAKVVIDYTKLCFFPAGSALFLPFGLAGSLGEWFKGTLSYILLLALGSYWVFKRSKEAFFSVGWYLIHLIPFLYIIPLDDIRPVFDRYLYLPSLGFASVLGFLVFKVAFNGSRKRKIYSIVLALCITFLFSLASVSQNRVWRNSENLWLNNLRKNPRNLYSYYMLSLVYTSQERYEEAEEILQQALARGVDFVEGHYGLARIYYSQNKLNEAEEELKRARRLLDASIEIPVPQYGIGQQIDRLLALVLLEKGEIEKPKELLKKAIKENPEYTPAYYTLGQIFMKEKRPNEAIDAFEQFNKKSAEKDAQVYYWLGLSLAQLERYKEALEALRQVLEIDPNMAEAYLAKAKIYANRGYWLLAIEECKKALHLQPENSVARDLLEKFKKQARLP